jgi:predicted alpha/beta-hydrolase family hydrolase
MVAPLHMTANSDTSKSLVPTAAGEVSVALDGPNDGRAVLVLAPGAGGGLDGPFMKAIATGLAARDLQICRFNFGYTEKGRRSPDKQPLLENTYRDVVQFVRSFAERRPLFLGGKSMGGRIASHIVAGGEDAAGLIFLGYPLHPPGRPDRIRDGHLRGIETPMLFVEGTRDPFCPLETLKDALQKVKGDATVAVIDDGDHSFKVRSSSGRSTEAAWKEVTDAVASWIDTRVDRS